MIDNFTPCAPLLAVRALTGPDGQPKPWRTVVGWTEVDGVLAPVTVLRRTACVPEVLTGPLDYGYANVAADVTIGDEVSVHLTG